MHHGFRFRLGLPVPRDRLGFPAFVERFWGLTGSGSSLAGDVEEPPEIVSGMLQCHLQQVMGSLCIGLQEGFPAGHHQFGRQMVDILHAPHRYDQAVRIQHVTNKQADRQTIQRPLIAGRPHQAANFIAPLQQLPHQMGADESVGACYQCRTHEMLLSELLRSSLFVKQVAT